MRKIISEDMIEQACIAKLSSTGDYEFINAYMNPNKVFSKENVLETEKDGTGRENIKEAILPDVLYRSLKELNPQIPDYILQEIITDFKIHVSNKELKTINYNHYRTIKNGIRVEYEKAGKKKQDVVRIVDFTDTGHNTYTLVSQMWIKGETQHRRPDLILFVNGLPFVFIELKNSDVKLKTAFDKNLTDYINDIPQLFYFNQFCVLSNGVETRLGSFTADYE